jgi:hypothetical protein
MTYITVKEKIGQVDVSRPDQYKLINGNEILKLEAYPENPYHRRLKVTYLDDKVFRKEVWKYANGTGNGGKTSPTDLVMCKKVVEKIGRLYQFTNRSTFTDNDSIGKLVSVNEKSPYPYERADIQKFRNIRPVPEYLLNLLEVETI